MRLVAAAVVVCALAGCGGGGGESTATPPASAGLDPGCEPQAYTEFVPGEPGDAEEVAGAAFARSPLGPGGEVERVGMDRDETLHVLYVRDGKATGSASLIGGEGAWSISEMTICAGPPSNSP
jgi:hypothetical protein